MRNKLKENIGHRIELLHSLGEDFFLPVEKAVSLLHQTLRKNKILIFGNGGSATQASHFAAELVNRYYMNRPPMNAISLTTDIANITSISNDFSYNNVFSRQVDAIGTPGDCAIGLTTSGKSVNVLKALEAAHHKGLKTIALCGNYKKDLSKMETDIIIGLEEEDTPRIQELHLFILHFFAEQLEILNQTE